MASPLPAPNLCLNCGTQLNGKFCHVCGQKKIEDRERTIRHFTYQFFGAAFFLENNFLRNILYLISRPGFLAKEYLEGRRKRYMTPISLFLLINLVFFFTVSSLRDLNLPLTDQLYQPQHKALAKYWVDKRLKERSMNMEEYASDYNEVSSSLSKTLIILHAPVLAGFLMLLYWRRNYFYSDLMMFSLYLMGFILFLTIIMDLLHKSLRIFDIHYLLTDSVAGYIQMVLILVYLFLAVRRFYNHRPGRALLSTVATMIFFVISHFIYRSLLFFTVFWTT
jgi:hypothetical protein